MTVIVSLKQVFKWENEKLPLCPSQELIESVLIIRIKFHYVDVDVDDINLTDIFIFRQEVCNDQIYL